MKPGEVMLPLPGEFDPMTPTHRSARNTGTGTSFITQIANSFRSEKYTPIRTYEAVENQADPLLWDESDEEESKIDQKVNSANQKV
jgi:hypothetical protein